MPISSVKILDLQNTCTILQKEGQHLHRFYPLQQDHPQQLTPPAPSTYANGASPITFLATSATVVFFLTRTQSLKTAFELEPDWPDEKEDTFLTGNTGTRPSSSAARDKTWTTPVEPKRYRTISFRFSMRPLSLSSSSFKPPPVGSPSEIRSSRVSTNSLPSVYFTNPCLANFRRNTSEIAEHRTIDAGSCI
jgi:hypothetical protein